MLSYGDIIVLAYTLISPPAVSTTATVMLAVALTVSLADTDSVDSCANSYISLAVMDSDTFGGNSKVSLNDSDSDTFGGNETVSVNDSDSLTNRAMILETVVTTIVGVATVLIIL